MGRYKISTAFRDALILLGGGTAQYFVGKVWSVNENQIAERSGNLRHGEVMDGVYDIQQKQKAITTGTDKTTEIIQKGQDDIINAVNNSIETIQKGQEEVLNAVSQSKYYLKWIKELIDKVENCKQEISSKDTETAVEAISTIKEKSQILNELIQNSGNDSLISKTKFDFEALEGSIKKVEKIINKYISNDGTNKFLPDFNVLYEYLDTLSLLQVSAFLHIIIFLILILTLVNIVASLFGNEIIKFFNLENKYPKLDKFFKLRAQFQKYYLMWNVSLMFIVCICSIGINLIVLI